jgi:pimeloyl-ACP methyl ester carboxylesterase
VILYLHGFGSSARSSKATFFASRLAAAGVELVTPDFNEPDFSTITVSRMVGQVTSAVDAHPGEPVALIGSSLGGFVAVQTALQRPERVDRLVLMAPALDLTDSGRPHGNAGEGRGLRSLGDRTLDEWRETNCLNVFHHTYGRVVPIRYDLYEDCLRYDSMGADLRLPVLVFQGRRDDAVDPDTVERWARARPNVELHMLDDDHQLLSSLEFIWAQSARFLGLR